MPQKAVFKKYSREMSKKLSILPDKYEENAHNTLSALWHTAAGNRISAITANYLEIPFLAPTQYNFLEELIERRLSGIPLAHLTERQHFMGLDYILNKGHYIPRKETELLAGAAINLLQKHYSTKENVTVIDLCSGIGTIALAIAYYCGNANVFGSDIYKPAIVAAEINAKFFGLNNRATFCQADLFDAIELHKLKGKTDLVVCAPPYISTLKVSKMAKEIAEHEPSEAFEAGPFGLSVFNKFISESPEYLCEGGFLIFECGLGQGEFLAKRLSSNKNYSEITEVCDQEGNTRVLMARKI